jgi:hypothetical protein
VGLGEGPYPRSASGLSQAAIISVPSLLHFSDLEDFRAAIWARTLDRRATILHRHLFGVFDLDLLSLLDAVTLGHRWPSFHCLGGRARGRREIELRRM